MNRYQREADFHDKVFADGGGRSADRFYSVARASKAFYREHLKQVRNGQVLEYGCGPDSHAPLMAPQGSQVLGVDISLVAIQRYREVVRGQGVFTANGCVMNAEELALASGSFDLVCGLGILHHLDVRRSLSEIARVLKPSGTAVFLEPLAHNPLINAYRRLTPSLRTPDEHPLTAADLDTTHNYFEKVEATYFSLSSLMALPLNGTAVFSRLLTGLDTFDRFLFRNCAPLRKYAWAVALVMTSPKTVAASR